MIKIGAREFFFGFYIILIIPLLLVGCDKNKNRLNSVVKISSALNMLNNSKEWGEFWVQVGTGENVDIGSSLKLTVPIQNKALLGLQFTLREDTRNSSRTVMFDEKLFIPIIDHVFTDSTCYINAYAELANHALNRDEKVGRVMYAMVPKNAKAWETLPLGYRMLSSYFRGDYESALMNSKAIRRKDVADVSDLKIKEIAEVVRVTCNFKLHKKNACVEIDGLNTNDFPNYKNYIIKLKDQCSGIRRKGDRL